MFNRKIEIKVVKDKAVATNDVPVEPAVNYVAVAEEAISRLGKQLLVGTVTVIAMTIVTKTLADTATEFIKNSINK